MATDWSLTGHYWLGAVRVETRGIPLQQPSWLSGAGQSVRGENEVVSRAMYMWKYIWKYGLKRHCLFVVELARVSD